MRAGKLHFLILAAAASLTLASCGTRQAGLAVQLRQRVPVEDSSLYLEVRGNRSDTPVLLWLHGGPGGAERPLFQLFNRELEQAYRVAYYDQRGSGRSFAPDEPSNLLTVERHVRDLHAVIQHLKSGQRVDRVILVGHSWGSLLGMLYAARHPEDVTAFVGVAQVVAPLADQHERYRFVRASAEQAGDDRALAGLARIGYPPLDGRTELELGRLVDRFGGVWHRRPSYLGAMLKATVGGFVTLTEIPRFIRANERSVEAMTPELLRVDLRRQLKSADVPLIFFLGKFDRQVSQANAAAWLRGVAAPSKSLRVFAGSAHNIPFEEPAAFADCLTQSLERLPGQARVAERRESCPYPDTLAPIASAAEPHGDRRP